MVGEIEHLVESAMATPWVWVALFAVSAIDAFFPMVPSESLVVTAGAFAASTGEPHLAVVIASASVGAFVGDHVSYLIGRRAGRSIAKRAEPGSKRAAALDKAGRMLATRGPTVIIICRYIPGARTAVTLTAGAVRYPLRRFTPFDALAGLSWGVYSGLIGYIGGSAFEEQPLKGVILGLVLAFSVAGIIELVRHLRARRAGTDDREQVASG